LLIAGMRFAVASAIACTSPRCCLLAVASLVALALSPASRAAGRIDDFPNKPIRVIHGFAAGSDAITRTVAGQLAESWKQQVVVDNRPSAGGIVAAQLVASANADGYTLLSVTPSQFHRRANSDAHQARACGRNQGRLKQLVRGRLAAQSIRALFPD
jgi:hypothetical protein